MPLTIHKADARMTLTLSRPEQGNALSHDLVEALHRGLDEALGNGTRMLVIEGEGRNFCTGFDLAGIEAAPDADLLMRFIRIEQLLARLWSAPFATLAIAGGRCFGAGADLFAACSTRLALPDASFSFPGAAFGLVLGTRRLAARIGEDEALSIIASGETVDAEKALETGLATGRVSETELEMMVEKATAAAVRLDPETFAAIRCAAGDDPALLDRDLAALVRSAVRPGLAQRICDYRAAMKRKHMQDKSARPSSTH